MTRTTSDYNALLARLSSVESAASAGTLSHIVVFGLVRDAHEALVSMKSWYDRAYPIIDALDSMLGNGKAVTADVWVCATKYTDVVEALLVALRTYCEEDATK